MIDTSAKWLMIAGLPALQVVFARYAGHFVMSLIMFVPSHGLAPFRSNAPAKQFLRSAFLLGSTVLNFTALHYLPITVTTTIMFAGPIAITLLSIPILGEVVGRQRIIAVCTGFVGVIVVMQPWGVSFHPAMFLSLAALVVAAMYFIMTRMLAGVETNATSQVWSSGISTLCIMPFAFQHWVWPTGPLEIAVFLAIGAFAAFGHTAATFAHRLTDASILAPVVYIQLFLAGAVGIFVFDTYPTIWTLVGGLIIIAAGIHIWHRERQRGKSPKPIL
jgi:drug/metabolite transporter (DMT)-like permease